MNIDRRFERAVESEAIRARRHKDNIECKINSILRESPLGLSEDVYAYAQKIKQDQAG